MNFLKNTGKGRFLFIVFLVFYVAVAFFTYKDYGITWDERDSYLHAGTYIKHYLNLNDPSVDQSQVLSKEQSTHDYLYPALVRVFNRQLNMEHIHLFNMLFCLILFWVLFEILLDAIENAWFALSGPLCLYLILRFSGNIPGDPKDMPLAVLYTVTLMVFYFYKEDKKNIYLWQLGMGTLIGLSSCIRIMGITLLPVFVCIRLWDYWHTDENKIFSHFLKWISKEIPQWILIFVVSQFWMMALWPYLGSNYIGSYINVFHSSQSWSWNHGMLLMGKVVQSTERLWYYLPLWLSVSMPLFILVFFFYSFFATSKSKNKSFCRLYFLFSSAFLFNLGIYLVLRPVIYNGIRLYLFLVPIICLLAVLGWSEFFKKLSSPVWKWISISLVGLNILLVLVQLFELYPYQYIYLNELAGGVKAGQFDGDYSGASLKEAAQWLVKNEAKDPRKTYFVQTAGDSFQETYFFTPNLVCVESWNVEKEVKKIDYRIELSESAIVDPNVFTLTPELKKKIVHVVEREGVPLAYVFKLK